MGVWGDVTLWGAGEGRGREVQEDEKQAVEEHGEEVEVGERVDIASEARWGECHALEGGVDVVGGVVHALGGMEGVERVKSASLPLNHSIPRSSRISTRISTRLHLRSMCSLSLSLSFYRSLSPHMSTRMHLQSMCFHTLLAPSLSAPLRFMRIDRYREREREREREGDRDKGEEGGREGGR
jgi:hypothetical protein